MILQVGVFKNYKVQMLKQITIITIAFHESKELFETYNSIYSLIESGIRWILVINQPLKNFVPSEGTAVIEGKDKGLYDALNLGLIGSNRQLLALAIGFYSLRFLIKSRNISYLLLIIIASFFHISAILFLIY